MVINKTQLQPQHQDSRSLHNYITLVTFVHSFKNRDIIALQSITTTTGI